MPVVSGYSMDLYCDCRDCTEYRRTYKGDGGSHQFTIKGFTQFGGENFRECLSQAKKAGWVFKERKTVCFAPGHGVKK